MPFDFLWVVWLLVLLWFGFVFWRGLQSRQQRQQMLSELQPGDEVVTNGGLIGTVRRVEQERVEIMAAPNVSLWFIKSAILSRRSAGEERQAA